MDNRSDTQALRIAIEAEARRLGFELFGVTTPAPPPHLPVFEAWLEAGRHGTMAYLATERARLLRADPTQILPECRSILIVGMRYPAPPPADNVRPASPFSRQVPTPLEDSFADATIYGRVAAYAWGMDYHLLLPEKLKGLVAFIETQLGRPVANRWYTDTGPVLERDLAQRAGLGWIGKNTCLINPDAGSYFLLAEILLEVELAADAPFVDDRCGTCTRCLDACPTRCIRPDRTLEAQRCISYLTIELKDAIPPKLRPQLGEWIFGCDICQQVCPWNRRAARSAEPSQSVEPVFGPSLAASQPDLAAELDLDSHAFRQKFKGSPVERAKRRGYLRNVAVALGNRGDRRAAPALVRALQTDPEPLVRGHAAWALGNLGGEIAFKGLVRALECEVEAQVCAEIRAALHTLNGEKEVRLQ